MIVVKVEMWPGGDERRAEEFSRAYIANEVTTTVSTQGRQGTYTVRLMGGIWGRPDCLKRTWKMGKVEGFDRVKQGVWDLIYLALRDTVGYRNPPVK
jgi:hypothetical protein